MYPIRILHIVGSMHPGGMENFIMNLYENIDRDRFQFDVIVHMRREDDYVDRIRSMGGRVYELPRLTKSPAANLKGIRKIVRENGYPVVIRHTPNALVAPQLLAAKKGGAVAVCHSHNETDPKKILHLLGRAMLKRMSIERFACSERAGKWMFGKKAFRIVHNAVDIDKYCFQREKRERLRREFGLGDGHVYGHVANFIESKNHTYLMRVYAGLAAADPGASFVCIGDGELRRRTEEEAETLGIRDRVIFTGVRFDTDAWMSAMDVLIFPSLFEGLPLTLIEAQASGLPCLISRAVTGDVEVTQGLLTWESVAAEPSEWVKKALLLAHQKTDRSCQRESIARHGYDIRSLAEWYEQYFEKMSRRS